MKYLLFTVIIAQYKQKHKQKFFFAKKPLTKNLCSYRMELEQLFRTNVRGVFMKKKYRIISKKRFYLFLVTVLAICFIALISIFFKVKAYSLSYDLEYHQVEVVEGDTLWNIALDYLPEGKDVRKLVYEINVLNENKTNYIYPGDIIKVPIH